MTLDAAGPRPPFGAPAAAEAANRLKQCTAASETYPERVFQARHETPEEDQ